MSKKAAKPRPDKLVFVRTLTDLSRRGDIDAFADVMKAYWKDKKSHPWHMLYKTIEANKDSFESEEDLAQSLLFLRDAVFGVLELGSLSLPLQIPTEELLDVILSGRSWVDGRRKARAYCADMVAKRIEKRELDYLVPSGLARDGLGYMVSPLQEAQLEQYRDARPTVKDGKYDLKQLARSCHGYAALRAAGVTESQLGEADPRAQTLVEAYDRLLVELELEVSTPSEFPQETLQTTLNGDLIEDVSSKKQVTDVQRPKEAEQQQPLTEFIPSTSGAPQKVPAKKTAAKKTRKPPAKNEQKAPPKKSPPKKKPAKNGAHKKSRVR